MARGRDMNLTFRYSFVASCHSLFMELGAGPAWVLIKARTIQEPTTAIAVCFNILQIWPGGGVARGPWGPNAMK
jgi:hypothetical protein